MKRMTVLLLCLLPFGAHAQHLLWEAYANSWRPIVIEFFKDYYAQESGGDDDAIEVSHDDEDLPVDEDGDCFGAACSVGAAGHDEL